MTERQSYVQTVEQLLEAISDDTRDLRRLKTWGVRGPALADRKHELDRVRMQLAELVAD